MKTTPIIGMLLLAANVGAQETNLAVKVRHAPALNGGRIQGSLQELNGEGLTINGGFVMTGDLAVPGTPIMVLNGHPAYAGTIAGSGSTLPSGYRITLNGNCSFNYLRTQTAPVLLPTVSHPPMPTGARSVSINRAGQSYGDPATLRNLTLNGNVGLVSVPPGTYGNLTANGGSGLVVGVAGDLQPVSYNLQHLTLNGHSTLKVVGPVRLTVANGFTASGNVGSSNHPAWLQLNIAAGNFTLNGGATVYGLVTAPAGTVTINGHSALVGTVASDRFILNGNGLVRWAGAPVQILPPVASNQVVTVPENCSTNVILTGFDPQGLALTYSVLTPPAYGVLNGTPPDLTYQPATNYFGNDEFTFEVNNGITDSAPAAVSLIVAQVYYPPVAYSRSLTNVEDTVLPIILTASDPQGYALTFSVLTEPAHGTLNGTAPNLTYLPATNYFGNDSFTFQVNDGISNSAAGTVSVTNQPVDDFPVVVAGSDQLIILPTNTASLEGSVTYDVFPGTVDTVLWRPVSGPGEVIFSNATNTLTMATFSTNGIYRLQLLASDSFLSSSNDVYITVDAPPAVEAGATMTNTFPGSVNLQGIASDDGLPTNGTLTVQWSMVSGPGTVLFGNPTLTNSAATFSASGIYVLRLTADDSIATNYSDVTVIENLPPTVNAGTGILTNGLLAILNGSVSDDALPGSFLSVEWSQAGGPGTVVFGNAQGTNTMVAASQSGTYLLTLTAFDGAATNSDEVAVTFNLPPDVNAGPEQTVNSKDTVTLAGTATDDQLPNNVLATKWTQVNGPGTAVFADVALTNTTVTFGSPGIYTLRLSASDTLATNSAEVVIRVNAAPVVAAGADQTAPFGVPVVLAGSYTDDGIPGPTVSTLWTQISGPATATFTDPTAPHTTVSLSQGGEYVFQLTADDGMTNSSAQVTITIMPAPPVNHPPAAQSQTLRTITNTPVNITLSATDIDNDLLTFQVLTGPTNGILSGSAPNLIYQPSPDFIGTDGFTFVANDGQTHSAPAKVTIAVQAPTNSLRLIVPAAQGVVQDIPFTFTNGNQIAIAVGTAGATSLQLAITVTNGTLTLASTNGLTLVSGANGTSNLVVSGSQDDLNNALNGLTYLGDAYFTGIDTVTAMVERLDGSGASDFKTIPIIVLPVLTYAGPFTGATENTPFATTYDDMYWNSDIEDGYSFLVESQVNGTLSKNGQPVVDGVTLISPGDSIVWTPPLDESGTMDAFTVVACDEFHAFSNSVPVEPVPVQVEVALGTPSYYLPMVSAVTGTNFWAPRLEGFESTRNRTATLLADYDTTAVVIGPDGTEDQYDLQAGVPTTAWLDWSTRYTQRIASDSILSNAFHIISVAPISVCEIDYAIGNDAEGYRLLPVRELGTNYVVAAYRNYALLSGSVFGSEFSVTATKDQTEVTIVPSVATSGHPAGQPYTVMLQAGQTYNLRHTETADGDLSGTTITATAPVSVLGGNASTTIPTGEGYPSMVAEQLPPPALWDTKFVLLPLTPQPSYAMRVVAGQDNTTVQVLGVGETNLNRGQFWELLLTNVVQVVADNPVQVFQYARGDMPADPPGNPSMIWVPGLHQGLTNCNWMTPEANYTLMFGSTMSIQPVFSNYVNVVVPAAAADTLRLNGNPLPADAIVTPVGQGEYVGLTLPIGNDEITFDSPPVPTYTLRCSEPFVTISYGFPRTDDYGQDSYGYAGPCGEPRYSSEVLLSILSPTNGAALRFGSETQVTARLTDPANIVTNIGLLVNGVEIAASSTTNIAWTPSQAGVCQLQLVADTSEGETIASAQIEVNVVSDFTSGQIYITSPTNGATAYLSVPSEIVLSFDDPYGLFDHAVFYANGAVLAQTTNTAYDWTPFQNGDYVLSAVIYSHSGTAYTVLNPVTVTVTATSIQNVAIISPADGEESYPGTGLPIAVDFADSAGIFDHLEVFTNGVSLGTATNSFLYWTPTQTNDYTLTATVYDVLSNAYDAANSVTVHIVAPPRPVITITSPADGSRVQADAETMITASLNDPASLTTNVQFYVDEAKVSDNTASYSWTPMQLGSHLLQAVALTSAGDSITSAPVNVTAAVLHPPVVTLLSPTNEQRFLSDQQPLLLAQATDADGVISNLSLSLDSAVMGNTNGSQLEILLTNIAPGWHDAIANATDNDNLGSSSDYVHFYVERREDLALPTPHQLTAEAISATQIKLAWEPVATNARISSILIERWDAAQSLLTDIGETAVGKSSYTDSNLDPETHYRYRIACLDTNAVRSAYSSEAGATTRTVLPNYAVINLSQAIAASLTNLATGANILSNAGLANFDYRRTVPLDAQHVYASLGMNAAPLLQAAARFKEQWPQVQLDYDPVLLSPKSILPRLGFLTGPNGSGVTVSDATAQLFDPNDPYRPVKAFVEEYQDLFGFGPEAITNAVAQRDYISPTTGAHTVVWQQQVAGIPVFNSLFIGNITANGELASVACEFIPAPADAADPSVVSIVLAGNPLPVSGAQAVLTAVTNVGDVLDPSEFNSQSSAQGLTQSQSLTATAGFKQNANAALTWFPASRNELKLAWQVIFTSQWRGEMYLTLVSASNGQILYRRNLTADVSEASYRVYTDSSPAPMWPGLPTPGTTQAAFVNRSLLTFSAVDTNASPNGWINDADNETRGNNVDAHLDRDDDDRADLPRPTGNPWRVFDFTLDPAGNPDSYGDAAAVQLFFWDNWMHDALYQLGFTEAAGNFQDDNFGRGGFGGDAVQADAQDGLFLNDGRHHNNANMSTPPDGYAPRMQMYGFDGATPARDGSLDAEIILHEYTHGLSSRVIGGGAGIDALQTAGMGEGWSDFYALSMLAHSTNDVNATYPVGAYVAYHAFGSTFEENYYYGIRHYPYCIDTNRNPLTFTDIDPSRASPHPGVPRNPLTGAFDAAQAGEVHNQGEVWCSMLWELRANLINKYDGPSGNALALQLVTDGLKLSPANPNFVQARDAILLADRIYSGGANAPEIWDAFAKRGLGFNAKAPESYTTMGARESRDLQPALTAERIEIQSASGSVELGVNNGLLVHLRNQGHATATHVSGHLSAAVAGVTVLQNDVAYTDVPPGGENVNAVAFQIQTGNDYVSGTPIDLELTIASDQGASVNRVRLYTDVPGAEILFDDYNALADPISSSSTPKDLTPWDIGNAEPLWMADDASCLLKAGRGKYLLWRPDGTTQTIVNPNFVAHRLTRSGQVVGILNTPGVIVTGAATLTNLQNEVTNIVWTNIIMHSVGVQWKPSGPEPLTLSAYQWPHGSAPFQPSGKTYTYAVLDADGSPTYVTNIFAFPELQAVWDMNANGTAVGYASFQCQPLLEFMFFDPIGNPVWFTDSERGLNAGHEGTNIYTCVGNYGLVTSAAQFNSPEDWRWLGPLDWTHCGSYATLINDAGMIAGVADVVTGDAGKDALNPEHVFRAPLSGECGLDRALVTDLGALPGGLHSFARAMNQAGDIVGYSDFQAGITPADVHAAYWSFDETAPEELPCFPPSAKAQYGFADAYGINDSNQIVGASIMANGQFVGVLWQQNHNTNGTPFWEITDLNDRLTDSSWQVFRAVDINNDGLILAHAFDETGIKHAVLLIPGMLTADVNRDRKLKFDGSDMSSQSKPFRFWINDDQDTGDVANDSYEDAPSATANANCRDNQVNGRRDLIDLFPVAMNLGTVLRMMPIAEGFEYHLSQADEAVNFVYTDLNRANGFDYLTQPDNPIYGSDFAKAAFEADTIQVKRSDALFGTKLSDDFLNRIQNDPNKGVILVEGRAATAEPLVLEIWKNDQKLAGIPLYLSLSGVEDMYRWINLRRSFQVTGETQPDISFQTRLNPPENFPDAESNGRQVVYVHGFNVPEQSSRAEISEAFKRLWQSGSKAMFTGVSWFADQKYLNILGTGWPGTSLDYYANVRNAFLTAPALADAVAHLPGTHKFAIAHSLGNMVVSSAIADFHMNVEKYFAIDAAVAIEAYDGSIRDLGMVNPNTGVGVTFQGWLNYDTRLWPTEWYQLFSPEKGFTNDGRYGLTWRNRFGVISNLYNFYSSGEEVLENPMHNNQLPPLKKEWIWVTQEMRKGTGLFDLLGDLWLVDSHPEAGWALNPDWYVLPGGARPGGNKQARYPYQATVNDISDDALRANPFCRAFNDSNLNGAGGTTEATNILVRAEILGVGLPALSHAIGANQVSVFVDSGGDRNMPLMNLETGWPQQRLHNLNKQNRWLHSDLKDVAYPFNHKLPDTLVELGGLN